MSAQVGGAGASDRQGAFTFTNVPPGKYVVRIVDYPRLVGPNLVRSLGGLTVGFPRAPVPDVDTMWAEVPVAVTDHDVADVPVMLTRAARLSGRIVFEDAAVQQPPGDAPIMLMRTDGREYGDMPFGVSEPDGAFRTVGVPPGPHASSRWRRLTGSVRWRTASVLLDHRNVFDSAFDVGTADIENVVVTMRLRMCTLSGNVRDASGALRSDASLYIFSTNRSPLAREIIPSMAGVPREIRPNRHGVYSTELPDGDNDVVAVAYYVDGWSATEKLESSRRSRRELDRLAKQKSIDLVIRATREAIYAARVTSFSTCPSRMWMARCACAATSASCVTRTIVLPASCRLGEEGHDLDAGLRVEVAGRLVGQQDRRIVHERARDRDALALAAGQLVRPVRLAIRSARPWRAPDSRARRGPSPARPRRSAAARRCAAPSRAAAG